MKINEHDDTWKVVSKEINARIDQMVLELTSPTHSHDAEKDATRRTKLFELRHLMATFTKPGVPNE